MLQADKLARRKLTIFAAAVQRCSPILLIQVSQQQVLS